MKPFIQQTLVAAVLVSNSIGIAGANEFPMLESMIEEIKLASGLPSGTAVAVIKENRVIYEGYFGYADLAKTQRVDKNTVFYIASSTKPFFALNALLMQAKGEFDTAKTLQDMFPDIAFKDFDAKLVTGRDLLVHTSGIDNVPLVWATAYTGIHDTASRNSLVTESYSNSDAAPGEFSYTNVGYNIFSVWLDQKSGQPWQTLLRNNIFSPLGMAHTSAYMSDAEKNNWTLARPYSAMNSSQEDMLYLEKTDQTMHAAGGMISTARDLSSFIIAELNHGTVNDMVVLPPEVIAESHHQQATTDASYNDFQRDGYAWGWYTGEYKGERMLHHFGGFAGFHAHLSFIPELGVGLIVLNNEDFVSSKLTNLVADYVYGVLLNEEDNEGRVGEKSEVLIQRLGSLGKMAAAQRQNIMNREWHLSQPMVNYAGVYANNLLGNIKVRVAGSSMKLTWGNLQTVATAYEQPDTVRVEFVPNSGQVLKFEAVHDKPDTIIFEGIRFERTKKIRRLGSE